MRKKQVESKINKTTFRFANLADKKKKKLHNKK